MLLGHLLVEAKLTEGNFQSGDGALITLSVALEEVFDIDELPGSKDVTGTIS